MILFAFPLATLHLSDLPIPIPKQKNAQAPLSQVYDHKSPLEQMHCAFLLPIMKKHGLAHLLDQGPMGVEFRRLLLQTVLATDMGVHARFMERFQQFIDNPHALDVAEQRILVCQALIKCADISNPVSGACQIFFVVMDLICGLFSESATLGFATLVSSSRG